MSRSFSLVDCQFKKKRKESDDEAETFCLIIFRIGDLWNLFQEKFIAYTYIVTWSKRVEMKMNPPEEVLMS